MVPWRGDTLHTLESSVARGAGGPESRYLLGWEGAGTGLGIRLLPILTEGRPRLGHTSAPQAGQLVQEPPRPSVSVNVGVDTYVHFDRDGRLGLSIINED